MWVGNTNLQFEEISVQIDRRQNGSSGKVARIDRRRTQSTLLPELLDDYIADTNPVTEVISRHMLNEDKKFAYLFSREMSLGAQTEQHVANPDALHALSNQ